MGRTSARRASNAANRRVNAAVWFAMQSFNGGTREGAQKPLLTCASCKHEVFTLIEGECFRCHQPVEGKNRRDMTTAQAEATHSCGIKNERHVDGWDGNWLDCEEAARR